MKHHLGFCGISLAGGILLSLLPQPVLYAGVPRTPCNTPSCVPNAKNFGYFETRWREWPGEYRPEVSFPRGVGTEIVRTPPGQETVPLPKAAPLPSKPPTESGAPEEFLPGLPSAAEPSLPGKPSPKFTAPGLPETRGLPETPSLPDKGAEPGLPTTREPLLEGLPGLTPEPATEPIPAKQQRPAALPGPASTKPLDTPTHLIPPEPKEMSDELIPEAPKKPTPATTPGSSLPNDLDTGEIRSLQLNAPRVGSAGRKSDDSGVLQADWSAALNAETVDRGKLRAVAYQKGTTVKSTKPALGGYCPVELGEHQRWVAGNPHYKVVHEGQVFLLAGPEQRKQFLADASHYAPGCAGNDPVVRYEEGRPVTGELEYSATYRGTLYLFSSGQSLTTFRDDPERYVGRNK